MFATDVAAPRIDRLFIGLILVSKDFYVDDGLTRLPSEATAIILIKDVTQLCQCGNLRIIQIANG
jgi:hypothetical protein